MNVGFTVWLTGLPSSGKTTVSRLVEQALRDRSLNVEVLDGDVVRRHLSQGLGFSRADRDANIERIAFVCQLLTRNGVAAIAAAISPYRATREQARKSIGGFVEVFVKCPVEVCTQRDIKGLYKKALAGEIQNFTGVNDPYEEPLSPEVVIETDKETPDESAGKIIVALEELGYIPQVVRVYSREDEEKIKRRLDALGYLG